MKSNKELFSKEYIFSESSTGELIFKGQFEEYYQEVDDPWGQSGENENENENEMRQYYSFSRDKIVKAIEQKKVSSILEIGCGLGYALKHISNSVGDVFSGIDISNMAIQRAKLLFPLFSFFSADIASQNFTLECGRHDVVIFNQLLWYILPNIERAINNAQLLLNNNGRLIISNAFARNQRYGKDVINGFAGAFEYFSNGSRGLRLVNAEFSDRQFRVMDGLFILEKKSVN